MSETETQTLTAARTPTVYFIDDSATMREVIKIAFRKENIHVITCSDAATALTQFGETAPDAVITDVIMPDKDGYEVCQFIKQHEQFGKTPVILMSGVVNRTVAEKAMAVKADELVRKPFQPQDLIQRVKNLLYPKPTSVIRSDRRAIVRAGAGVVELVLVSRSAARCSHVGRYASCGPDDRRSSASVRTRRSGSTTGACTATSRHSPPQRFRN